MRRALLMAGAVTVLAGIPGAASAQGTELKVGENPTLTLEYARAGHRFTIRGLKARQTVRVQIVPVVRIERALRAAAFPPGKWDNTDRLAWSNDGRPEDEVDFVFATGDAGDYNLRVDCHGKVPGKYKVFIEQGEGLVPNPVKLDQPVVKKLPAKTFGHTFTITPALKAGEVMEVHLKALSPGRTIRAKAYPPGQSSGRGYVGDSGAPATETRFLFKATADGHYSLLVQTGKGEGRYQILVRKRK